MTICFLNGIKSKFVNLLLCYYKFKYCFIKNIVSLLFINFTTTLLVLLHAYNTLTLNIKILFLVFNDSYNYLCHNVITRVIINVI